MLFSTFFLNWQGEGEDWCFDKNVPFKKGTQWSIAEKDTNTSRESKSTELQERASKTELQRRRRKF